jgi:tetratricopeptide (TPR) repeat protein
MAGGNLGSARSRCALRVAFGLLAGLLAAPWGAVDAAFGADDPVGDSKPPVAGAAPAPDEKSIIVESNEGPAPTSVEATGDMPNEAETLEPISTATEREPDLADPAVGDPSAEEPTLADEYTAFATDAEDAEPPMPSAENPAADDVWQDESIEPAETTDSNTETKIEAASFNGVTPGATTRVEVLRQWGAPAAEAGSGATLVYELENFPSITLTLDGDVVQMVHVELTEPADSAALIEKLGLTDIRPAVLADEVGTVSTAFPERGVTLSHRSAATTAMASDVFDKTSSERVHEIVIGSIEAAPFVLRAETSAPRTYSSKIADLETALRLDPTSAAARHLLSQIKLATGAAVQAEALAREAVDLQSRNNAYRLQWARCLRYLARYDQAVAQTRLVVEGASTMPIERAEALEQMGMLAALGSIEVQERAVPLHNKAIELADQLAVSEDQTVRLTATQLLIGAHLAVAERISVGDWKDKDKVVAQWISRASALSEELIESGEADVSLRLQVALSALAAGAKLDPPIDPHMWIVEAEQAATELTTDSADKLAKAVIEWQLGLAYCYATEISHRRGESDDALKYGDLAVAALTAAAPSRQETPDANFVLGRVYFQIGAVHAVHLSDHVTACQWYDRAIEPLSKPVPMTSLATPGLHGDALVSMGVSYWENGDRDRAYELTTAGVELVEQGINEGLLPADALETPRNNFLAMSRALGKIELSTPVSASEPVQTAQQDDAAKRRVRPANGGSQQRTATRRNSLGGVRRR